MSQTVLSICPFPVLLDVLSADLFPNPSAVSEGALRVQVHADGSKLVQLLLQFRNKQGEGVPL